MDQGGEFLLSLCYLFKLEPHSRLFVQFLMILKKTSHIPGCLDCQQELSNTKTYPPVVLAYLFVLRGTRLQKEMQHQGVSIPKMGRIMKSHLIFWNFFVANFVSLRILESQHIITFQ